MAVIAGNSRVVKKLLVRGADRKIKNCDEKTPIDIARENSYHNILKMMEIKGFFKEAYNIENTIKPNDKSLK